MTTVYIALGANLDPESNILRALAMLKLEISLLQVSTFYRTEPIQGPGQPLYLNGVVQAESAHGLRDLKFGVLRQIEEKLGRDRTGDRYAPRTSDLDILLFGDTVISEADLAVPDPDLRLRPFLMAALLELTPDLVLPNTRERLREVVDSAAIAQLEPDAEFSRRAREIIKP